MSKRSFGVLAFLIGMIMISELLINKSIVTASNAGTLVVQSASIIDAAAKEPVNFLYGVSSVKANVSLSNSGAGRATIILAAYDSNQSLLRLVTQQCTMAAGENTKTIITAQSITVTDNVDHIKLFIWDDISNLKAISPTVTATKKTSVLSNTLKKLDKEGNVKVGYIGGSITYGVGSSDYNTKAYAPLTTNWLRTRFPGKTITDTRAAVSGTGSDLGTCRIGEELLAQNPDLIFVEFAVNDQLSARTYIENCMEGIVRQIKIHNPNTDIIFINSYSTYMGSNSYSINQLPVSVKANNAVAYHYKIPSINMGGDLYNTIVRNSVTEPGVFMNDASHPTDYGHQEYAKSIIKFLGYAIANNIMTNEKYNLPAPMGAYITGSLLDVHDESVVQSAGSQWQNTTTSPGKTGIHQIIESNQPGDKLTFSFSGTGVGLYLRVAPDTGTIKYSIDGGAVMTFDTSDSYTQSGSNRVFYKILLRDLQKGNHDVTIEVGNEKNSKATDYFVRIGAFLILD